MTKYFSLILALSFLFLDVFTHSGKPKFHAVIDTDGAIDDMRAITMLLSANDIRILAITCSEGTLKSDSVFVKVKSLLSAFHHEGIQVGVTKNTDFNLPKWSPFANSVTWGNRANYLPEMIPDSRELLNECIKDYMDKVTLIALGSLKTYAEWISANPGIIPQIERIIWYNDHEISKGFNYQVSPSGYHFIKSTGIRLDVVSNVAINTTINQAYLDELKLCNSIYAKQILKVYKQKAVVDKMFQNDLYLWDDLVPLYLTIPIIFDINTENQVSYVSLNKAIPRKYILEIIAKLLDSSIQTNNRVFNAFPVDKSLYKQEYAKIIDTTIADFGLIEWKAITLTNEIHGHTGIYSIIGAKMGIRAMEYFNVGINNMYVTSFAGNIPPLSCFNDGLQISTGATIGQGLISIAKDTSYIPLAIFEFNKQKVQISLKEKFAIQMQNEIIHGVRAYGSLTDQYWIYIEELALRYWIEFDRHEIFTIEEIQ